MAYGRTWNAGWQVGAQVHYFGAYDHDYRNPIVATIKSISPKLGHAVVEVPQQSGVPAKEVKFQLDGGEYARQVRTGSYESRYRASIHLITEQHVARIAKDQARHALQVRRNNVLEEFEAVKRWLTAEELNMLEGIIAVHKSGI